MSEPLEEIDPAALIPSYRTRTPARVLVGRAGESYRTETSLSLRSDHAFARDAVQTEIDLSRDLSPELIERFGLFLVQTQAANKAEFLKRPDLGRRFNEAARNEIGKHFPRGVDLQIAIGDGLSTSAVATQVPQLLPNLIDGARSRGWSVGQPFVIRYCRVGILNEIGDLLEPTVAILLIGERPGLATAESLSAYMAYRPQAGCTDAQRNLISNIHARGIRVEEASERILNLAQRLREMRTSGVAVKESLAAIGI